MSAISFEVIGYYGGIILTIFGLLKHGHYFYNVLLSFKPADKSVETDTLLRVFENYDKYFKISPLLASSLANQSKTLRKIPQNYRHVVIKYKLATRDFYMLSRCDKIGSLLKLNSSRQDNSDSILKPIGFITIILYSIWSLFLLSFSILFFYLALKSATNKDAINYLVSLIFYSITFSMLLLFIINMIISRKFYYKYHGWLVQSAAGNSILYKLSLIRRPEVTSQPDS